MSSKKREKSYPGERGKEFLSQIRSRPSTNTGPVPFKTANYNQDPTKAAVRVATPAQKVSLGIGVALILFFTFLLYVGTLTTSSFLATLELSKRYLLAGSTILVGGGFIVWGAKNWKDKGILLALMVSAPLILITLLQEVRTIPETTEGTAQRNGRPPGVVGEVLEEKTLRLEALQDAVVRARSQGLPAESVVGVYIKGLSASQAVLVEDYLNRRFVEAGAAPPLFLPRGENERLVIAEGIDLTEDELDSILSTLGETSSLPVERGFAVELDQSLFSPPTDQDLASLSEPTDPYFFEGNLEELRQINSGRTKAAATRLAAIPDGSALQLVPELSNALVELIEYESDVETHELASQSLIRLGVEDPVIVSQVGARLEELVREEGKVAEGLVEFLLLQNFPALPQVVDTLWLRDPSKWQNLYAKLGAEGENLLLEHLDPSDIEKSAAAIRVLHELGREKSLERLTSFSARKDPELAIIIANAEDAIRSRIQAGQ